MHERCRRFCSRAGALGRNAYYDMTVKLALLTVVYPGLASGRCFISFCLFLY